MAIGPITDGKDFNYFTKLVISTPTFPSTPQVVINFKGQEGLTLNNETSGGVVEYSFNGTTLHGEMDGSKTSKDLKWDHRRVSKIWFRLKSGSASTIRVEAWAKM